MLTYLDLETDFSLRAPPADVYSDMVEATPKTETTTKCKHYTNIKAKLITFAVTICCAKIFSTTTL